MKFSGKDLSYFDEEGWNALTDGSSRRRRTRSRSRHEEEAAEQEEKAKYRFVPHVIEPSAGADRFTLAFLCEAYTEDEVPDAKGKPRRGP